jgi:four helix bundle protein
MNKYRSLDVWKRARELSLLTLQATDAGYHPRHRALFDQLRRAALSVEANIVEGYALGTRPQLRRHLRIAVGSAAEAEIFIELAEKQNYLSADVASALKTAVDRSLGTLFGFLRANGR